MDEAFRPPVTGRRHVLRMATLGTAAALAGTGLEGILAARRAPAYAPATTLHVLLWKNFSPPADVEIVRQGAEWGRQNKVNVRMEQINGNDIPARAAAAMENRQGPDIIQFFHNWQNQYAAGLVDLTDICTSLEARYGGYLDYARAHATLDGRFTAAPHTIVPNIFVVRRSWMRAAGTQEWPRTWEELRREGKKWKKAGRPIGQTIAHTFGDAIDFTYPLLWSFGVVERDERGRVVLGGKAALEALKFFKALWDDAMDPAGIGWDDSSNNRAFLSGGIITTNNAPSIYLTAMNQVVLDERGAPMVDDIMHVPNPAGPAGAFHYHYTQHLAIPRYSRRVDAARDFLRWLMEGEQLAKYLRRGQAYQAGALRAYMSDPMWEMFPALKPYRDHLTEMRHVGSQGPADARAARVVLDYVLIDMLAAVATGKMTPEGAVRWCAAQLERAYGQ